MRVAKAYLELTAARPESQPTTLDMQAELSGNAPGLKFEKGDLSRRQRTAASVKWEPSPWTTVGEQERSPNLAPILEEVFAQTAWQSGNAVVLLIHGAGQRAAQSPDQDRRGAPKLYIELQQKSDFSISGFQQVGVLISRGYYVKVLYSQWLVSSLLWG